jgi:hypothetical protein
MLDDSSELNANRVERIRYTGNASNGRFLTLGFDPSYRCWRSGYVVLAFTRLKGMGTPEPWYGEVLLALA